MSAAAAILSLQAGADSAAGASDTSAASGACAFFLLAGLYFLPWLLAAARNHHNRGAIALLNLLLGWTFIGWVVSLVWAATRVEPKR